MSDPPPPPPRPSGPPLKPDGPASGPPPGPPPPPPGPPWPGPGPEPWPPPDWEQEWDAQAAVRSWRRRLALAIVALVAIVGLLASMLIAVGTGDDETDSFAGDDLGPGTTAPTTTAPGDPPDEDELRQVVDQLSAFVEDERGLEFEEPVDVELAADRDFEERLLADFDEEADELESTGVLLAAFGLIEPGLDVVEAMRSALGAGVLGFYDPETEELVVRGTELTPYVRSTVVHELVHALDDQHFELHRPDYDDADDEVGFGFSAVVEGNARRIENAYVDSLSDDERRAAAAEEMEFGLSATPDMLTVPRVLIELLVAPYEEGVELVEALVDGGGQEALDRAFEEPPRTSEQVLDPEAYLDGESRAEVPHPEPDGEALDEGVAGQLLIEMVLSDAVGSSDAAEAAEGWGGDWAVVWRDGGRSCVALAVVGDTAADTAELREAFGDWAEGQDDATVAGGSGGSGGSDDPVTVEACAG